MKLFCIFSEDSANEDFLGAPPSPAPRPVTPLHFDTEVFILSGWFQQQR